MKQKNIYHFFKLAGLCLLFSLAGINSYGQCPDLIKTKITITDANCNNQASGSIRVELTDSLNYILNPNKRFYFVLYRYLGYYSKAATIGVIGPKFSATFTGLPTGAYDVLVARLNGASNTCTVFPTYSGNVPPANFFSPVPNAAAFVRGANITNLVTVREPVGAYAGSYDLDCDSTSFQLGAQDPAPAGVPPSSGSWAVTSGPSGATFSDRTNPSSFVNNLQAGDYIFQWKVYRPGCDTIRDNASISVRKSAIVGASTDTNLCAATSYPLKGSPLQTLQSGQWSLNSGPNNPTIADPSSPSTNVSGLVTGTYKFIWTISTGGNCSDASDTITIVNNASPAAPLLSASLPVVCAGQSSTLNCTNCLAGTTYAWSGNGIITPGSASQTVSPLSTTTYSLVTTINGCASSPASVSVTVNPLPVVSVNPASSAICAGTSTVLTASGATNYSWSPATGLSAGNTANPTASPATTITYTVTGTTGTCSGTKTVTVTVNPTPAVNLSPASAAICAGASTVLTASGATSYSWSPATGLSASNTANPTANPASTTTYTVTGTTGACSSTRTVTVTVNPIPIVIISPAAPLICDGGSTVLTASGATSYSWSPATGLSASNTANPTASPATTTTYTVTGTTGTCSGTKTVTVTVNPTPAVNISPASAAICAGASTVLTASGATSYSWSPATGLSAGNTANPTASPAATTTYTVTGVTGSCSATKTVTVTVNPLPTVNISPVSASICAGSSAALTANGATNYSWSPAAGLSASNVANPTATPAATTTYTVTGITGNCSNTKTVTVTVIPVPVISINPVSAVICSGTSTTLTASGATSYTWSPATGLSTSNTANTTASPATTTTYTVTGVTGTCSGTKAVTVTVNPTPTVNIAPLSPAICAGASTSLTASGATSYTWSPSSGLSATNIAGPTASPGITTTYTVTGTTGNCSNTRDVTVTVTPLPTVNVNPASSAICAGTSTVLIASGATSYSWSPATGLSTSNTANTTASPATTTTYTVTGTTGSCSGTKTVTINVNATPVIDITPLSATICAGASTLLTASGATNYSWSPSAGLSASNVANPTASPAATTTYTVTGTNGTCSGTKTVTVTVNPLPAVNITPVLATICAGAGTVLTASGATNYSWSPATGLSASNVANPTATPATTTTYTVTGTTGTCTNIKNVTVTVTPVPVVDINPATASICSGTSTVLTASGATNYIWSPATGLSASNIATPTASPTATTTYTVTGTTGNCSATKTLTVTVNPTPAVTISPASATICAGASTGLTASGATNYVWSPSAGLSSINIANPTATPATTTTYTVTGTTGTCSSTRTVTITVNPVPAVTVSPASPTICAGSNTVLTASGATSYSWSPATGLSANNIANPTAAPATTTTYTVTGTAASCSSTQTITVTVTPLPAVNISPASASICAGSGTVLTASGATSYVWSPATGLSASNIASPTASPATTTTYTVAGTTGNCTNTRTVTVTVNPLPTVNINPASATICSGSGTVLTASGATSYSWSPATGLNASNIASPTAFPTTTTTYTVTGTTGTCTNTKTVTVTVNSTPDPPSAISGKNPVCQSENNVPYAVTEVPGVTYTWSYSNGTATVSGTGNTARVSYSSTASNGVLSVTASIGTCSNTTPSVLNVIVTASPALPVVSSHNSPICIGNTLNINLVPQAGITFDWVLPSGATHSGTTYSKLNVGVTDGGNYLITAKSGTCSSAILTFATTVNPGFVPVATALPVCVGGTLAIGASGVVAPGATYTWTGPNSFTNNNQSFTIPNAQLKDTGNYFVTAHVGNCNSVPVSVKAIVNPIPLTPGLVTGPDSICQGVSVQTYSISSPKTGETYTWSYSGTGVTFPSGNTGNSVTAAFTATATSGSIQVSAVANACSSAVKTFAVTINALPVTAGSRTVLAVCQGNPISLNAATVTGATYTWSGPNGFSRTGQTQTISNANLTDAGSYAVTYSLNGCIGDSDTTIVTVNPTPSATFTYPKASYCQSEPNTSPVNVPAGSSFSSLPAGLSIAPATGLITLTASTPGTYTVTNTVTSGTGCKGTSAFSITILKSPVARTFTYAGPLCDNASSSVSPSFTSLGDPGTFSSVAGLTINSATGEITPATSTAGTHIVTYTSVAGSCSSFTTSTINILLSPAKPSVSGSQIICQGKSSVLTASSGSLTNFNWFKGTSLVQSGGNTLNVTTAGSYSAIITASNGCKSSNSDNLLVFVAAKPLLPVIQGVCPLSSPPDTLTTQYSAQPGYTYEWLRNKVSTATTPGLIVNVTGSYSAIITETASGCVSDTSAPVIPFTGGVAITVTSGNNPFCSGDSLQVASGSATGNSWSLAGNFISAGNSVFIKSGGQLILTVTNGSCSGKDTLDVITILSPAKPLISSVSDSLCPGSNLTLSTTASASLQWLLSGTNIAGQTNSSLSVTTAGAYQVKTTSGVCSSTSDIKNIGIRPVPVKPLINLSGTQQVCQGKDLNLNVTNYISGQDQWYFAGFPVAGANGTAGNLSAGAAGIYKVVRTTPGGCAVVSDSINLTINPNIAAGISISQNSSSICAKTPVIYTVADNNAGVNPTFQWFINGKLVQAGLSRTLQLDSLSKTSIVKVVLTSSNTCSASLSVADSVTTTISPNFKLTATIQGVGCSAAAPGSVNLVVTNSSGALTFTGQLLQANTFITIAGNYNVRITDTLTKCFIDTIVSVGRLSSFTVDASIIQPTCYDSNGAITIMPKPASGTYTVKSGTLTSLSNSNLGEGTFSISIEDSKSLCTVDTTFTLASAGKFSNVYNIKQPDCGSNNGSVTITSLPVGSYNYFGMLNQATTSNLSPNMYVFTTQNTITGCSKTDSVKINGKPLFDITASITPPLCGTKGTLNLTTTPLVNFTVSGDLNTASNPSLSTGSYRIKITDNTTQCFKDSLFVLKDQKDFKLQADTVQPVCFDSNGSIDLILSPAAAYNISGSLSSGLNSNLKPGLYNVSVVNPVSGCSVDTTITLRAKGAFATSVSVVQPDCGQTNGSAVITPFPTGSYTFTGGGFNASGANPALKAGEYTVLVSNNVCSKTDTIRIGGKTQFSITASVVQPLCNKNGSVSITTSPAISFKVSGGLTQAVNTSLKSGIYNFTVTDNATGCFKDTSVALTDRKDFTVNASLVNPKCFSRDGSVTLNLVPAGPAYVVTGKLVSGLNSKLDTGVYNVNIINPVSNCSTDTSFRLTASRRFINTVSAVQPNCSSANSGTIRITSLPGGNYTYEDATGKISSNLTTGLSPATYIIITDNGICTKTDTVKLIGIPDFKTVSSVIQPACPAVEGEINITTVPLVRFSVKGDLNQANNPGLSQGTYNFTVTDSATGCFEVNTVVLNQKADFVLNKDIVNPECFNNNGSVNLSLTPDTSLYNVTGTLIVGLNENLDQGSYFIKVVDQKTNCELTDTIKLTANGRFTNAISATQPDCGGTPNGVIRISTTPSGVYSYSDAGSNITGPVTSGLAPGLYVVTTTNTICSRNDTVALSGFPSFKLLTDIVRPDCKQSTGSINLSTDPVIKFGVKGGLTQPFNSGLPAAVYSFTITDSSTGCFKDTAIALTEIKDFAVNAAIVNPRCFQSDGSVNLNIVPANPDYTVIGQLAVGINSKLDTGSYRVNIINPVSNCAIDTIFRLVAPGRFTNVITATQPDCGSGNKGTIRINTLPAGTYTYEDATGKISSDFSADLSPSRYIIITDNNVCTRIDTVVLTGIPNFQVLTDVIQPGCLSPLGFVNITTLPLTRFRVSGPVINQASNPDLPEGSYSFTVTDSATGCFSSDLVVLKKATAFSLSANVKNPDCRISDGEIRLNVSPGPNLNYIFEINQLAADSVKKGLSGGVYHVSVTDKTSGCRIKDTLELSSVPDFRITSVDKLLPACQVNNGFIKLGLSEDSANFRFDITNGSQFANPTLKNIGAGLYKARIFRAGTTCMIDTTISLSNATEFRINVDSLINPDCRQTNGKIILSYSGVFMSLVYDPLLSDFKTTDIRNKQAGDYRLRLSILPGGCIKDTVFTLKDSPDFSFSNTVVVQPLCNANNGEIMLKLSDKNGFPADTSGFNLAGNLLKFSNKSLGSGVYTVKVKRIGSTCSGDTAVTLVPPAAPVVNLGPDTLAICNSVPVVLKAAVSDTGTFTFNWYADTTLIRAAAVDSLSSVNPVNTTLYTVRLLSKNGCSSQDSVLVVKPSSVNLINTSYLENDENRIRLNFKVINLRDAGKDSVYIYRRSAASSVWSKIDSVPVRDTIYTKEVSASDGVNYYKIGLPGLNSCKLPLESRSQRNIRIAAGIAGDEEQDNESSDLNWTRFVRWDSAVAEYQIYRSIDGGPMVYYASGNLDTLANFMNSAEGRKQCYRIRAIEKGPGNYESWSNISCINYQNRFKAYNIFTPNGDGHNDFLFFKNLQFYPGNTLHVFNRWGNKVFSQENYTNDWDGGGLPAGTYFFILDLKDGSKPLQGDVLLHR